MPNEPAPVVRDNAAAHQYEVTVDGHTGILRYARKPGVVHLVHTEVPPELQGRGLAGSLAKAALEAARTAGERVVPSCPFVQAYLKRHPEYQSLVA